MDGAFAPSTVYLPKRGGTSNMRERGTGSVLYLGMAQEFGILAELAKYSLTWPKRLPNGNQRYRDTCAA